MRQAALAGTLVLGALAAGCAGSEPRALDLGTATLCFRDALADGADGRGCLPVLAEPCAEAVPDARGGCLDDLALAFAARARARVVAVAPFYSESDHAQLRAGLEERLVARARCAASPLPPACRLHLTALLAYLVEFQPEHFIAAPEAEV
ncbi:MAG: hypothetical protein AAGI34_05305 [Pseudomonadota bacterium]